MPLALLALAISAFAIGTTEFVIMGLLPEVTAAFGTSIPTAGMLISGYALGVAIGAPILAAAFIRLPRKPVLLGLMVLFIVGNALSALAPSYGWLMFGRIVASLSHGAFFGIGAVVAADLVAPERKASAVAMMFTGLTVANVLGVPFGTLLGQHFGWRATFAVVSLLGVISFVGIGALVPRQAAPRDAGLRRELATFRDAQVWLSLAITTLGFAGVFASFTYIAPMMTELTHFPSSALTPLLVVFGLGLVAGNLVGGRLADRSVARSLYMSLSGLLLVLVVFAFSVHSQLASVVTLFAFGFAGFATVPAMQTRIMQKAAGAPTLASAGNIAAFNLGNAAGAWLAGLTLTAGYGYTAPNWVGAALAASGLAVLIVAERLERAPLACAPAIGQAQEAR